MELGHVAPTYGKNEATARNDAQGSRYLDLGPMGSAPVNLAMPYTGAFRLGTGDIVTWCSLTSNGLERSCNNNNATTPCLVHIMKPLLYFRQMGPYDEHDTGALKGSQQPY